jgi:UDP-N-acetylmuramoyl-tripeptide--D-alanyl-D-alanine ligase
MQSQLSSPTLADVWTALTGRPSSPELAARHITTFTIDSRRVRDGSCFVALPGEHQDGHEFMGDALQRGARAAISTRGRLKATDALGQDVVIVDVTSASDGPPKSLAHSPCVLVTDDSLIALQDVARHWRSQFDPRVVAVTGSVGKSTSKEMIAAVLAQRYPTLKSPGNLNNEIGLPLTILELRDTHQRAVLEMGMYDLGEIAGLAAIARPQVGVITNIGPTHLERLGTLERIAQAKAELVVALPEDGVAVLNGDDPLVRPMADVTSARIFFYGLRPELDLWASQIVSEGLEGIRFRFHHAGDTVHVKVPLLGRHSVHTALRAAAVGLIEGLSWQEIVTGLHDVSGQLRLLVVQGIHGSTLVDDTYNASPASSLAALNLLDDLGGRRIAVLGDMMELGSFEEAGHRLVGCRAADVVQLLVTVGSRARWIADEAIACGMAKENVHLAGDIPGALDFLRGVIQPGDTVLVKGSRSMGLEEIVATMTRPSPSFEATD